MGFPVYDYRKDIRNFLVTPQIRSRFYPMKVGQVDQRHTHDLGHEIFFILQGQAEFEIDGEKEVLGPGQLCEALARTVDQAVAVQREEIAALKQALAKGNTEADLAARDKMWAALSGLFSQTFEMAEAWNDLATRTTDSTF